MLPLARCRALLPLAVGRALLPLAFGRALLPLAVGLALLPLAFGRALLPLGRVWRTPGTPPCLVVPFLSPGLLLLRRLEPRMPFLAVAPFPLLFVLVLVLVGPGRRREGRPTDAPGATLGCVLVSEEP